jgi:drug/metabolite transporter (DMT)-like permease
VLRRADRLRITLLATASAAINNHRMSRFRIHTSALAALGAAALFGASTPLAKQLVGDQSPLLLAGLLYLGSGVGLTLVRLIRDRGWTTPHMARGEWSWLLAAIAFGGAAGPALLMTGLQQTAAGTASLLLNLEAVLTAALAWIVFKENTDRRIVLGMGLIVAGGAVLAWPGGGTSVAGWLGPLAIAGACLCWAIDNNLTRKVSAGDAVFIAAVKGLIAGAVNTALALSIGAELPSAFGGAEAGLIGFFGYGVSLVLFVVALRGLGSARTGAYFSTAPFIGAALAIGVFHEPASAAFWIAAVLMAGGIWLHLTERHEHEHTHQALFHLHPHVHDEHHQHVHDFPWDGREPHTHSHQHAPLTHTHPHYPDIHHRHEHS